MIESDTPGETGLLANQVCLITGASRTLGAAIARRILEDEDYDAGLTGRIVDIIERHDSGVKAYSQEERLVKDADRLWRFSKVGMWQELGKQGGVEPMEYHDYVGARIDEWFFTPTAAVLAREELAQRAEEIESRI